MQEISGKKRVCAFIVVVAISALLLSLPWLGASPFALLIAFVPMLAMAEGLRAKSYFGWVSLFLSVWVVLTQYWIYHATIAGVIASVVVQIVLFAPPFIIYHIAINRAKRPLAYTLFVASWIAFEYIYTHNSEVSHPWIVLGNGFAESVKMVQWYEYTGVFGGSLWVLIVNLLVLELLRGFTRAKAAVIGIAVTLPMVISLAIYHSYEEEGNDIKITVIQPNIDPYTEKFEGGMSKDEQRRLIGELVKTSPKDVDYIVAPETAISDNINIDNPLSSRAVRYFNNIIAQSYPNSELIIGASMFKLYPKSTEPPTITARKSGELYYDGINGALFIDGKKSDAYIKSKLVVGVEKLPYPKLMKSITFGGINLGGMSGALITQEEREVFEHHNKEIEVASSICYESIYGEYMAEFVRNGAELLFIITNDGWWRDTHGYKQHYSYARLRAIENRRSIARSANTGISGFISQRGDDISTLGWDKRGVLTESIKSNDKITFYVKYGDYIARATLYIFIISLLFLVAYIYKKRSHLN